MPISHSKRRAVTKGSPCPVCKGDHKCSVGDDGLIICGRAPTVTPLGFVNLGEAKGDPQFVLFRRDNDLRNSAPNRNGKQTQKLPAEECNAAFRKSVANFTPERRRQLAEHLGIPDAATACMDIGWMEVGPHRDSATNQPLGPCWTMPEFDARDRIIGVTCRYLDGTKRALGGFGRGLAIAKGWQDANGALLIAEGHSDVIALHAVGLSAVGRPSNTGGISYLIELLRNVPADRPILILGEFDANERGKWPGLEGAVKVSSELTAKLGRPVPYVLPPRSSKDVREYISARRLDPTCSDAWPELGAELFAILEAQKICQTKADVEPAHPVIVNCADLKSEQYDDNYLWQGILYPNAVTLLLALWKSGKTTLMTMLLKTMEVGGVFLGYPVRATRVLYVTEEHLNIWVQRRDRYALGSNIDFISRPFVPRKPSNEEWQAFITWLHEKTMVGGHQLVILDTLSSVWPVKDENDAAQVQEAFMPIQALTTTCSVLLVHHMRKSDGDEGVASRGSGALPASVDVILELRREDPKQIESRRRVLRGFSRWDTTPGELVIELDSEGQGYSVHGTRKEAVNAEIIFKIWQLLPRSPPGSTLEEIRQRWPDDTIPRKQTLLQAVSTGTESGKFSREGSGKKCDPYRFWAAE